MVSPSYIVAWMGVYGSPPLPTSQSSIQPHYERSVNQEPPAIKATDEFLATLVRDLTTAFSKLQLMQLTR